MASLPRQSIPLGVIAVTAAAALVLSLSATPASSLGRAGLPAAGDGSEPPLAVVSDLDAQPSSMTAGCITPRLPYLGLASLSASLFAGGVSYEATSGVALWARHVGSTTWSRIVTATAVGGGAYRAQARVLRNTFFRMRFDGSQDVQPCDSDLVLVNATARLGDPAIPRDVACGTPVAVTGVVRPFHAHGHVHLDLYRQLAGRWRRERSSWVALTGDEVGLSRYLYRTKLSKPGRWFVRTRHSDMSHLPSQSRAIVTIVR